MTEQLSQAEFELLCEALEDGFPDMLGEKNPKNRKNHGTIFDTNPLGEEVTYFMPEENAPSSFETKNRGSEELTKPGIYADVDFSRDYFALHPFGFNLQKLKCFYNKKVAEWRPFLLQRYSEYLKTAEPYSMELPVYEQGYPNVFDDIFSYKQWIDNILVPYSKIWFEHQIAELIRSAIFYDERLSLDEPLSLDERPTLKWLKGFYLAKQLKLHFIIGRMVEHYKWKFKFEHSIVRKNLQLVLAGSGGGKASSSKRTTRLEAFMEQIEALAQLTDLMAEERLLAQAWDNASNAGHDIPKTPKVRFEYEVQIRSVEPFKARYEAIFRKTP